MKKSFFVRYFFGLFFLACLLSISIFFFSLKIINQYYLQSLTNDLTKLAQTLVLSIRPMVEQGRRDELDPFAKRWGKTISTRITVIDAKGVVLADSEKDPALMENHGARTEVVRALNGNIASSKRYSTTVKANMLYVAVPFKRGEIVGGAVRVSLFLNNINKILFDLKMSLGRAAAFLLVVSLIIAFFLSRRIVNPLRRLSSASEQVARGNFDVRVFADKNDDLQEVIVSFNTMTEKIRTLFDDLSAQQEELKNIISFMQEGLLVLDKESQIIVLNEHVNAITGMKDLEGRFYWEAIRETQFGEMVQKVKGEKKSVLEEIAINDRIFLCSMTFMEPQEKVIVILFDISEIKKIERIKKDFVVNVSHELRTPLTAIKGFVETMEEEEPSEAHKRYLGIIKRHTERLISIVKDLLRLSELEEVQKPDIERVDLNELIEQLPVMYEQQLREKNLVLRILFGEDIPFIMADPFKLEELFINLIDNAITYTEEGSVTIRVERDADYVVFIIQDTGIGMYEEHLTRIFERFYVADKSRSRNVGGTGLGLSIVKHIVLLHRGTIAADSTPGAGTTFTIRLPVSP